MEANNINAFIDKGILFHMSYRPKALWMRLCKGILYHIASYYCFTEFQFMDEKETKLVMLSALFINIQQVPGRDVGYLALLLHIL